MMSDNLAQLAIAKICEKDLKGFKAPQGKNDIDVTITLRVKASITKGADVDYTPTVDIPLKATLALVLEKAGFSREYAAKLLTEAMTEALEAGEKGNEAVESRLKDIDLAMDRVSAITAALPKKTRSGPTTVKGSVVEVVPVAELHFVYPAADKEDLTVRPLSVDAPVAGV